MSECIVMHHLKMHHQLPFDVGMHADSADCGLLYNCADLLWKDNID